MRFLAGGEKLRCFDTITSVTDRQTDRQADGQTDRCHKICRDRNTIKLVT